MGCLDTEVLVASEPGAIERAGEMIKRGLLVAYPTDTLYGLGAYGWREEAVGRVFVAKGRAAAQALPLLIAGSATLVEVARDIQIGAWRLASAFWPGALTLVLRKKPAVPDAVSGGGDTVAVRVPDHYVTRALITAVGAPIAGTSANRSGGPSPLSAMDVLQQLGGRIEAVLDGGPCPGGVESTILDLSTARPRLLRRGAIELDALEEVLELTIET